MIQKFIGRSGSQIGTADTDHQQHIGILADLFCRLFDAVKLFLIIIDRKINPSQKIISGSRLGNQHFFGVQNQLFHILHFFFRDKWSSLGIIECNFSHTIFLLFRFLFNP